MSRGQETEVNTTAGNQNATFNQNAQNSYNNAQTDIGDYQAQLSKFAAANPYGTGGAYQTAVNQSTANTADAASQAAAQAMQGSAVRTGQNAAGAVGATTAIDEANTRNLMAQQATNNASRINSGANYGQQVLNATQVPATMEANLAGQQAGAGNTALETQQKAAETPSLSEELMGGVLSAGNAFAGGFGGAMCPAQGSLYLMADGSEKPVEILKVGEWIAGIDGEAQEIEEIQSAWSPVLRIATEDGFNARNSRVHAFALPLGGFTVAINSLGKTVRTAKGTGKVVSVEWDEPDFVFNVITGGSHTYRADGIWALGVGEAERQVSMIQWNHIGDELAFDKKLEACHGDR